VRRLAQLLGFYDRFVEVQMDGFSNGASWRGAQSISGMLTQSGVREGEPGILALDEFQRFRTIDNKRAELRVERNQDVWTLLSDGRLPPALSLLGTSNRPSPRPPSTPNAPRPTTPSCASSCAAGRPRSCSATSSLTTR